MVRLINDGTHQELERTGLLAPQAAEGTEYAMTGLLRFFACALSVPLIMTVSSQSTTPLPGGYRPAEVKQEEVKGSAAFAVAEEGKREGLALELEKIVEAQQQVVAGMNYRLTLKVKSKGKTQTAKAVVFRGLDQHHELKMWEWLAE